MSHYILQSGSRVYIFLHAVVEFEQLILVVRHVGTQVPSEVLRTDHIAVYRNFDTAVHHGADVLPTPAFAGDGIGSRHIHQDIGGFLMIEVDVHVRTVEKSESYADVVCPRLFPAQIFVAALCRIKTCLVEVIGVAGNQCEMLVEIDLRVTRCTGAQLDLCTCQPFHVFQESLVLDVPHKA